MLSQILQGHFQRNCFNMVLYFVHFFGYTYNNMCTAEDITHSYQIPSLSTSQLLSSIHQNIIIMKARRTTYQPWEQRLHEDPPEWPLLVPYTNSSMVSSKSVFLEVKIKLK